MIKIEAVTLEDAYKDAAKQLECSITEIHIEVVQSPSSGFLGLFKKKAIIVAARKKPLQKEKSLEVTQEITKKVEPALSEETLVEDNAPTIVDDTIMPTSFVSDQDEDEDIGDGLEYTADYDDAYDEDNVDKFAIEMIVDEVKKDVNQLFLKICFEIDEIEVKMYDKETLLIEFKGEDAALLIGKEGYRYKALSYMLFNWINAKYNVGLRLEIAEFLKNQEESVGRYLESVYESVDRDGRAQTKILDGVLVQIALRELRERYPDKYVVIRSTKDGLKYIIINDYHN